MKPDDKCRRGTGEMGGATLGGSLKTFWRSQVMMKAVMCAVPPAVPQDCCSVGRLGRTVQKITAQLSHRCRNRRWQTEEQEDRADEEKTRERRRQTASWMRYMEMFGWKKKEKMHSCLIYVTSQAPCKWEEKCVQYENAQKISNLWSVKMLKMSGCTGNMKRQRSPLDSEGKEDEEAGRRRRLGNG